MRPPSPSPSERSRLSSHFDEEGGGSEPSIILATGAARVAVPRLKSKSIDHAEPSACARCSLFASRCAIPVLLFVVLALLFSVWIAHHHGIVRSLGLAQIDVRTPADSAVVRRALRLAKSRTWGLDYDYMHV